MRKQTGNNGTLLRGLLAWALVLSFATVFAGEAFAPAITPPEKMQNRDMWMNLIEQWEIPDKEAVAVAAYPGAYVVACMAATKMASNGVETTTLPALTLATEDDQATVTAFYKKELADWNFKNAYDMFDTFWTGPEEFNSMDVTQAAVTPNVTVFGASAGQTDFMPTAKTAIVIVYKPVE